ncbi:hypothetical protein ORI99_04700, partial [Alishewanella sp. SMS9]|nr:hypothetical protein [Alishewanella sp. SMS9]
MELSAYRGKDNIEKVAFNQDEQPLNFDTAGVTAIKLLVKDEQIAAEITGDDRNVVAIKTGALTLRPGTYDGFIVAISPEDPNGVVIAG